MPTACLAGAAAEWEGCGSWEEDWRCG